jgi:hypothetical protein
MDYLRPPIVRPGIIPVFVGTCAAAASFAALSGVEGVVPCPFLVSSCSRSIYSSSRLLSTRHTPLPPIFTARRSPDLTSEYTWGTRQPSRLRSPPR